ncbi:ribonucleotide-diphosphate reductase subunit beta [Paenibacillus larvae]|uniref:Ribonucleoside-diphosphate reductase subunit beta n=1 Tax=Paenibacillus larvae subsp. larvae DSM 25430 TaxID=697284 RepID=V9W9T7_9BACL|nr:ribonucleotide-diphosphate reductase subunit beta [Paenibacillus larvae]AHD06475.1 ribonucleoside-diphosphate reductase subunit beta [Paenibacillus larvae subsp. larvae DSM 25430]AVG13023.1 ribonucleoside-diphosphate reductase subunit beta [Paenibacillus larvae subsp. larvae DSM 25430]MDR5568981.1 ribonucleotide-diphosphate reductase subunit beta [Paenibacillus larvae]MDR5596741.1 ribonucleotide-diphosphate reductase subunit beta [Paenibacillus larvae]
MQRRKLYDITAPNRSTGIINGQSSNVLNWDDCRFPWAYPMYRNMLRNFWIPDEVPMTADIKQWSTELGDHERDTFKKVIGLLAFLDSVQTDYSGKVADYLTDSSLSALMSVLSFQEVVHNQSYSYVLSSLVPKAEQDEIFEYWKTDEVLRERNDFLAAGYQRFVDDPTPQTLMESVIYDIILEGLFFYSGFAFFYNMARNGKMLGTNTMIRFINRDEEIHVRLFTQIFRELLSENPELDNEETHEFVRQTFRKAADLEIAWSEYIIGDRFDGVTSKDLDKYVRFMANKRVNELGIERPFEGHRRNNLRWIKAYEENDAGKTDFFESRVTQYVKVSDDNGFDEL